MHIGHTANEPKETLAFDLHIGFAQFKITSEVEFGFRRYTRVSEAKFGLRSSTRNLRVEISGLGLYERFCDQMRLDRGSTGGYSGSLGSMETHGAGTKNQAKRS